MGLFSFLGKVFNAGDKQLPGDLRHLTNVGYSLLGSGDDLTKEGLSGLRSLNQTYADRLKDPLGDTGRGIFAAARGNLADDAVRAQRSSQARIFQLARQNGGFLSPEAQAELTARGNRDISQNLFSSENDLGIKEGAMTLDATSKLFDRMEGIQKTIVSVGSDNQTRALQTIIASLAARNSRVADVWGNLTKLGTAAMAGGR